MAVFDTVLVEYDLPVPTQSKGYVQSESFQTKDLDNIMATYKLDKKGQLWYEKAERVYIDGDQNAKSPWDRFGHWETISSVWSETNITDTILLYDYVQSKEGNLDYSIEYQLVIIDGIVSNVVLTEFETFDNAERKEKQLKFDQSLQKRIILEQTLQYKLFIKPYNSIIKFIFRNLYKLSTFLNNNVWKWERKLTI